VQVARPGRDEGGSRLIDDSGYALRPEFELPAGREALARDGGAARPEHAITME
jgi:ferredoxin